MPPDTLSRKANLQLRLAVPFGPGKRQRTNAETMKRQMSLAVHGYAQKLLPSAGTDSFGYWLNDSRVDQSAGSLSFQPDPKACPFTFSGPHQGNCSFTAPALRWVPHFGSRSDWLPPPASLRAYMQQKRLVIFGDSLGMTLWRGMRCFAVGYGGLAHSDIDDLSPQFNSYKTLTFFLPRDFNQPTPSYDDFLDVIEVKDGMRETDFVWMGGSKLA